MILNSNYIIVVNRKVSKLQYITHLFVFHYLLQYKEYILRQAIGRI